MSYRPYLIWNDHFSVGHPTLDEQHKAIFEIINDLFQVLQRAHLEEAPGKILEELVSYGRKHFATEEQLLSEFGFEGLADQQKSHNAYLVHVSKFKQKCHTQDRDLFDRLLKFLKTWWLDHILQQDMAYRDVVVRRETLATGRNYAGAEIVS